MQGHENGNRDPKVGKEGAREGSGPMLAIATGLCLLLLLATAAWIGFNRKSIESRYDAEIRFTLAPDTVAAGKLSRFVAVVTDKESKAPYPGRVVDVTLGPESTGQILAVTGADGRKRAVTANHVFGLTDSAGKVEVLIRVPEAGDYTMAAADTASKAGATVNFRASGPGG